MNQKEAEDNGMRRLAILSKESGHSLSDLLDWYQWEFEDIGRITEEEVRGIVGVYIKQHRMYRDSSNVNEGYL